MAGAVIRMAELSDAPAICAIYAPIVRDTVISFELEPPDTGEMRARMKATMVQAPWLVYERSGVLLGYAYATRYRPRAAYAWTAETTVYVADGARRQRVATALYTALLAGLRWQGYRTLLGVITLPNPASVALHESFGFRALGVLRGAGWKLGRWHDTGFWQLVPDGHGTPDGEPAPPAALARAPEWHAALAHAASLVRAPRDGDNASRHP